MSFMAPTKQGNHLLNLIHYSYNYLLMEYNQLCVVTPHGQQCQYSAHSTLEWILREGQVKTRGDRQIVDQQILPRVCTRDTNRATNLEKGNKTPC